MARPSLRCTVQGLRYGRAEKELHRKTG